MTKWHLSWLQRWLGYARWYFYLRLHLTKLFYHRYVSRQKCPKTSTATQNFSCNLNFLTWKILNNLIPISSFTYFYGNLHIYRFPNFRKSIQRKQVLLRSKVGNNLTQLKKTNFSNETLWLKLLNECVKYFSILILDVFF